MMPPFYEKCYTVLRKVPKGKVTTYGEIAKVLHSKAYRAVGSAMHNNPYSPAVPCHRVVNSNGDVGGFYSGTKCKIQMLKAEGVDVVNNKIDLKKHLFKFK
jgi:methylated-DNA-[protein]-cysteine S-methyltransferase